MCGVEEVLVIVGDDVHVVTSQLTLRPHDGELGRWTAVRSMDVGRCRRGRAGLPVAAVVLVLVLLPLLASVSGQGKLHDLEVSDPPDAHLTDLSHAVTVCSR